MKTTILLFLLFLGVNLCCLSQRKYPNTIYYKISDGLNSTSAALKQDSIAFYSFAYILDIERIKDSTVVRKITANDPVEKLIIPDRSFLTKINYRELMGDKNEIKLVIPMSLIIVDYNSKGWVDRRISFSDFTTRIEKLFNVDETSDAISDFVFFRPIMMYHNLRVFD